ncbi:MAG: histidinol dehydrogenase [Synergistaceae bacterium]|nr:histidinol dehydrogenase [Synergistaceae bacterium]
MIGIIRGKDFVRKKVQTPDVSSAVAEIIAAVREEGDKALLRFEQKFDGVKLSALEVPAEEIESAVQKVGTGYMEMLARAANNIREFHERQVRTGFILERKGALLGQRITPIEKVGLYIPGGKAAYPSSVLMNAIPAKIAGCSEIVITTPPPVKAEILAAARVAGVDRVFTLGGAQAVAALAYGTESVPKVCKIVGPGNVYVAEAKRQVFGEVGIDMIAGPSEIVIVADETARAEWVAADLLAQAEHDANASAILVTWHEDFARKVQAEVEAQLVKLEREEIARKSIDDNGAILLVSGMDEAAKMVNEIAPEHLELCVRDPFGTMGNFRNAGSVFLGGTAPEALGDYFAGSNHVLPTMGTAKFSSPLSVEDFVKTTQFIYYDAQALESVADDIESFARSEGLTGHANSITIRRQG